MSDRLKKVGMFSTDSNFCFSTWVREVVQRSVFRYYFYLSSLRLDLGLLRSRHDQDIRTTKSVSKIAMEELSNVD